MPRTPDCPYMIEIVSTKTLRAREPDQTESRKPTEMRSKRPVPRTSSTVGSRASVISVSVRNRSAHVWMPPVISSTVSWPSHCADVADAAEQPEHQRGQ